MTDATNGPGDADLDLPIKLGPVSNGEFLPQPLGSVEREAIRRTRMGADRVARRLGMDRRRFLRSVGGAALMLGALAACESESKRSTDRRSGGTFAVPDDPADTDAAADALTGDELILDVQSHFLDFDLSVPGALGLAAGFPQANCGADDPRACFTIDTYLDELFIGSDTSMAIISALPIPGDANPESIDKAEEARRSFAAICGDDRLLIHGGVFPQLGPLEAALEGMTELDESHDIAAWKVYTHNPAGWWLDDHDADAPQVGNAFLDQVANSSTDIICVHKGLGGMLGGLSEFSSPVDIGPAATAHEDVRFVVYHSGFEIGVPEGPYTPETADVGVNRLITTLADHDIGPGGNVYAELGSTWWLVMRDPTAAAHVVGKLLAQLGPDRVLWGTDSIWYGSPQDQIQAFRSFEISPELQERYGYPELTPAVKAKIFGLNAAALYDVDPEMAPCDLTREDLRTAREAMPTRRRTYGPETAAQVRALVAAHGLV